MTPPKYIAVGGYVWPVDPSAGRPYFVPASSVAQAYGLKCPKECRLANNEANLQMRLMGHRGSGIIVLRPTDGDYVLPKAKREPLKPGNLLGWLEFTMNSGVDGKVRVIGTGTQVTGAMMKTGSGVVRRFEKRQPQTFIIASQSWPEVHLGSVTVDVDYLIRPRGADELFRSAWGFEAVSRGRIIDLIKECRDDERLALINGVLANQDDIAPLLVYADFCEERGEIDLARGLRWHAGVETSTRY